MNVSDNGRAMMLGLLEQVTNPTIAPLPLISISSHYLYEVAKRIVIFLRWKVAGNCQLRKALAPYHLPPPPPPFVILIFTSTTY